MEPALRAVEGSGGTRRFCLRGRSTRRVPVFRCILPPCHSERRGATVLFAWAKHVLCAPDAFAGPTSRPAVEESLLYLSLHMHADSSGFEVGLVRAKTS